jgi:multidrug resistance efflux pump
MSPPTVIPRPAAHRWRDAVARLGPVVVSIVGLAVVVSLWRTELFPTNFVGEAQSPSSTVASPQAGRLVDLQVEPYTLVTNGQALGRVQVTSPDSIEAMLSALRTDLEVMRVRMLQDQERNDLNRAQMEHDLLLQRLELVGTRIRLRQAESEFERVRQLYEAQLLSAGLGADQDGYEVALRDRDLLRAEILDKEKLVAAMEDSLQRVGKPSDADRLDQVHTTINNAIRAQEEQLRATEEHAVLRAAIDGMVMKVYRLPGEHVAAEEPLIEIRGVQPGWILGFVRQPIAYRPQPGDLVRVMSRGRPRRVAEARVLRVGAHLENFTQPLRVRGFDASLERGLPVVIEYPQTLSLQPGELVDLIPLPRP